MQPQVNRKYSFINRTSSLRVGTPSWLELWTAKNIAPCDGTRVRFSFFFRFFFFFLDQPKKFHFNYRYGIWRGTEFGSTTVKSEKIINI